MYLLNCVSVTCVSSFENSVISLSQFNLIIFSLDVQGLFSTLYFLNINPSANCLIGKDFFPLCRLLVCWNQCILCIVEAFQLQEFPFITGQSQFLCYKCLVQKDFSCFNEITEFHMLPSIRFRVFSLFSLMMRPLAHSEFSFVKGVRYGSIFILSHKVSILTGTIV